MSFLHPAYLLGLLGLGVPVLIHLFGRRRPRRVPFPSLRLVRRTTERQRALLRLRHLIVLLLRMLAVLFFVLALAGPRVRSGWLALALGSRSRAVVVLLDDSASTGATAHGRTVFDVAADAARQILQALPPGETAALARISERHAPALTSPTAAAAAIPSSAAPRGGAMAPGLEQALRALLGSQAADRRIYILTDLQATAWRDVAIPAAIGESLAPAGVRITVVDCGLQPLENWAVADVFAATRPVVVGRPVRLKARLERFGGDEGRRRHITLRLAENPEQTKSVVVEPNGAAYVAFTCRFSDPGAYAGQVQLPPDALAADNVSYFVVRVGEPVRALCLGAPQELRYVQAALCPPGAATSPVAPMVQALSSVSTDALERAEVVVAGQITAPADDLLDGLADQLSLGVLLFLGDGLDTDYYNEKLLPGTFGEGVVRLGPLISSPPGQYHVMAETETDRAPLRPFAEPQAGDLTRAHYTRSRQIELGPGARVLARLDNGIPALVESTGQRRAILVNGTADDAWSDAPFQMAFVPLMHHLVYYLAEPQRPEAPRLLVGQPFLATERAYTGPDGSQVSAQALAESGPTVPGVYRDAQGKPAFAANLDPRESDLRPASPPAVRRALRGFSPDIIAADDLDRALAAAVAPVADLSSLFFLLAFACLAGELWLSSRGRTGPEPEPAQ